MLVPGPAELGVLVVGSHSAVKWGICLNFITAYSRLGFV